MGETGSPVAPAGRNMVQSEPPRQYHPLPGPAYMNLCPNLARLRMPCVAFRLLCCLGKSGVGAIAPSEVDLLTDEDRERLAVRRMRWFLHHESILTESDWGVQLTSSE